MRILVVAPRFVARPGHFCNFPLGLAYVSAALKQAGHTVACLNLNLEAASIQDSVRAAMETHQPELVCTGGLSPHYGVIMDVLNAAARVAKVPVALGGGFVSSEPEIALEMTGADYGVIGEGELTMVELADALETGASPLGVPGLVLRGEDGNVVRTAERGPIMDLDVLPFPDFAGFGLDEYIAYQLPNDSYYHYPHDDPREVPIIGSRSCPFKCSFCYHPLGDRYRVRSLENIFAEVDHLVERHGVNIITFFDELFAQDRDRLEKFCAGMKARGIKWRVSLRVDLVDAPMLAMIKDAGCYFIGYGLESAHDGILKSMRKRITTAQIEAALEATWDQGIGILGNFIFGDKEETIETVQHTMDWWDRHRKYQINLSYIISYPGTALYRHACETGIIPDKTAFIRIGCPPLNVSRMSAKQYNDMVHMVIAGRERQNVPGKLLAVRHSGWSERRGVNLFALDAECPHCGRENHYENFHHNMGVHYDASDWLKTSCKGCNQRYDLPSLIHADVSATLARFPAGRACLLGDGADARKLLAGLSPAPEAFAFALGDAAGELAGLPLEALPSEDMALAARSLAGRVAVVVVGDRSPSPRAQALLNELEAQGVPVFRPYAVN